MKLFKGICIMLMVGVGLFFTLACDNEFCLLYGAIWIVGALLLSWMPDR